MPAFAQVVHRRLTEMLAFVQLFSNFFLFIESELGGFALFPSASIFGNFLSRHDISKHCHGILLRLMLGLVLVLVESSSAGDLVHELINSRTIEHGVNIDISETSSDRLELHVDVLLGFVFLQVRVTFISIDQCPVHLNKALLLCLSFEISSAHVLADIVLCSLQFGASKGFGTTRVNLDLGEFLEVFGDIEQDQFSFLNVLGVVNVDAHENFQD